MTLVAYIAYVATPYPLYRPLCTAIKATKGTGNREATCDLSDLSDKRSRPPRPESRPRAVAHADNGFAGNDAREVARP